MKKLLVILVAIAFVASFTSCSKQCSCTEAKTDRFESRLLSVLGVKEYKNCKEMAKSMNQDSWYYILNEDGDYVPGDWTCK